MTFNDLSPNGYYIIKPRNSKKGTRWTVKLFAENGEMLSTANQPFDKKQTAIDNVIEQIKAVRGEKALVWPIGTNAFFLFADGTEENIYNDDLVYPYGKV